MLPLAHFRSFISRHDLFDDTDKILLAVSGGKDSVLMAALFNALGYSFGVAHSNFKLRGAEADADEKFVSELALGYQVAFHQIKFDTAEYAQKHQLSIQMAARELRYQWFETIRQQYGYDYIALAHHQNDSVETVLLNLVRGTGISGLHGILPKRERLIRPLLFLSREEIDTIVSAERLSYREDSSNLFSKYARNKIRLEVVPKLKELNPSLEDTFRKNSQRFSELEDFLHARVEELRAQLFVPSGKTYTLALAELKNLQPLVLFELFKPFHYSEAVLEDLVASWNGQPGKIFESSTHQLLLDRECLILSSLQTPVEDFVPVNKEDKLIALREVTVSIVETSPENLVFEKNPNKTYLDAGLLHYPLIFRYWKKGDYFFPFGMNGKKKLSDFFTGLKIPLTKKNSIAILENGNGDIIWVAGYRSDERYRVTRGTKQVIIMEMQQK